MNSTQIQRFWSKVLKMESGCWEWQGARTKANGYGSLGINGKSAVAHRVSYELSKGPIPEGLFVCHRCNNKPCVNPDHLYLADNRQNIRDAVRDGLVVSHNCRKTVCPKCGGPYVARGRGGRQCVPCRRELNRQSYRRCYVPVSRRHSLSSPEGASR